MAAGISPHPDPVPPDLLFHFPSPPTLYASSDPLPVPSSLVSSPGNSQTTTSLEGLVPVSSPGDRSPLVVCPETAALEKPVSWVAKFKPQFKNLSKIGSPTMSSDGIPQIQAPDSIVLKPVTTWKNHIVAYFHGNPPSSAKIFSDLNPIWGSKGNISIKHHSSGVFLILIPNLETRNWVLDVGFWHSGNCSITVTP
ncbi:unnamed protein product [Microthlaspi erraticum]|uniref:DUF4283 domain-containing protein n=1 Tax=Microthlaspi erraticum TaxID=1685480 RepID=A0A6D2I2F0_9BRAS|nr:unnamed protein product [Microthlaspi erraticum]